MPIPETAPLQATAGVMHHPQRAASLEVLHQAVRRLSPYQLAAFHDLVALSGSLVLALAVTRGRLTAEAAWSLSRIDETWQAELWGTDDDAAANEALRKAAFLQADRFFGLCG